MWMEERKLKDKTVLEEARGDFEMALTLIELSRRNGEVS